MTNALKKTRAAFARAREIELIRTRLAVLSELESAIETNYAALHDLRAAMSPLPRRPTAIRNWSSVLPASSCSLTHWRG